MRSREVLCEHRGLSEICAIRFALNMLLLWAMLVSVLCIKETPTAQEAVLWSSAGSCSDPWAGSGPTPGVTDVAVTWQTLRCSWVVE